jgi:hypothetical protein
LIIRLYYESWLQYVLSTLLKHLDKCFEKERIPRDICRREMLRIKKPHTFPIAAACSGPNQLVYTDSSSKPLDI